MDVEIAATAVSEKARNDSSGSQVPLVAPKDQQGVYRKIDLRVCIVLGAISCISILDRVNIGLAAVAGMSQELKLEIGHRYNIAALVFYIPYLIFIFPSAVLAKKVGTRPLLMTICILWGVVTICTGFVKTWKQLTGLRALLGLFESAYYPVVINMFSGWYTKYEIQKRYAMLILITSTIASFSGVLAFGFLQMQGIGGLAGWRWTFIMEGIITVLVGVVAGFFVVDFPDKVGASFKFLTTEQLNWVKGRLRLDRDDVDTEAFTWSKFLKAARYPQTWLFMVILCSCVTVVTSIGFFLPIILNKGLGFSRGTALCLSAPPTLFAGIPMLISAWLGDKYQLRAPVLIVGSLVTIIGLVVLGWGKSSAVQYFSIFVINSGISTNIPALAAYQANNVHGQWMRTFSSAAFVVGGSLAGIFGAFMFGDGSPSATMNGIVACIALNVLVIVIVLGLTAWFNYQNRLAREGRKRIYGHAGFLYSL